MHIYYITDRKQFSGGEAEQGTRLLKKIEEAARSGVDYIQLREKDLPARAMARLAREAVKVARENSGTTKLLINSRIDIALACGADGVHLTSTDIPAGDARALLAISVGQRAAGYEQSATSKRQPATSNQQPAMGSEKLSAGGTDSRDFLIAVSTHTAAEIEKAYSQGADFVVFGPVFEKTSAPRHDGVGIDELRRVCSLFHPKPDTDNRKPDLPVLALGGITLENARACMAAGAAGIAAIRLFQANDIREIVRNLREA